MILFKFIMLIDGFPYVEPLDEALTNETRRVSILHRMVELVRGTVNQSQYARPSGVPTRAIYTQLE